MEHPTFSAMAWPSGWASPLIKRSWAPPVVLVSQFKHHWPSMLIHWSKYTHNHFEYWPVMHVEAGGSWVCQRVGCSWQTFPSSPPVVWCQLGETNVCLCPEKNRKGHKKGRGQWVHKINNSTSHKQIHHTSIVSKKKIMQELYFLCALRKFNVTQKILI